MIDPGADFKVVGVHKDGFYKLEVHCVVNEQLRAQMRNSQMIIVIVTKSTDIKVTKSTHEGYVTEEKKITYTFNNFNTSNPKFLIGMIFETNEVEFVEVVKVSYRYMVRDY
jgi:hypothetical protein